MKWYSVRVKLTLWNVAVLALFLGGFGFAMVYQVRAEVSHSIDRGLESRTRRVAEWRFSPGFREFRRPNSSAPARPFESEAERQGYFRRPRILDPEGRPIGPYPDDVAWDERSLLFSMAGEEVFSTVTIENEPVRVYSLPVHRDGKLVGIVQMAHALADLERMQAGQMRTLLTMLPIALLVAALCGLFLTDRALRPVRQVTDAAREIGAEDDLSRRLDVQGRDELAELAATFNGMIGRLQQAFRERAEAYQRLEHAYEQQRRFTADASHELRTPLTRIKGSTSLALFGQRTPEEYRKALQVADQAADTMQRIMQDLLLLARSDAGQLQLQPRPLSLVQLVHQAVAGVPGAVERAVVVDLPEEPVGVLGDSDRLTRVVVNLVENALRHTPLDGEVRVSARREGSHAVVQVRDTGEGIPAEHLPHVCERFYRVDSSRSRASGGTGLGLAICQSLVQAHGGELVLESQPGRGTTVTVRLPSASLPAETSAALPV